MGQNRWWLKLFFYLLNVGTSNALVLFKLAHGRKQNSTSIVAFKEQLVHAFIGTRLQSIPSALAPHVPTKSDSRNRCAHCALFSEIRRTRFRCSHPDCQLPLCSVGSGMVGKDCFALTHASEEIHKAVLTKHEAMKKKVNERFK